MEQVRKYRRFHLAAVLFLAAALLLLAGSALADEHHTFVLKCAGGGFIGRYTAGKRSDVIPVPETLITAEDDNEWTLDELRQLPDFRLEGAALRFTATSVQGTELWYALTCGDSGSRPQCVRTGRNLWDVTEPLNVWISAPEQPLSIVPM